MENITRIKPGVDSKLKLSRLWSNGERRTQMEVPRFVETSTNDVLCITSLHDVVRIHGHSVVVWIVAVSQFRGTIAAVNDLTCRTRIAVVHLFTNVKSPVLERDFEKLYLLIHTVPNSTQLYRQVRYRPLSTVRQMWFRIKNLYTSSNSSYSILGTPPPSCDRSTTSPLIKGSLEFSSSEYGLPTSAEHPLSSSIHHNELPDILCGALYRRDTVEALLIIPRH